MKRQRAPLRGERDLPALGRLSLLGGARFDHRDTAALERQGQGRPSEDFGSLFLQRVHRQAGDVEVEVFGVADTLKEETEIAAAFDGEAVLVRPRADQPDELKMEELDDLSVREHESRQHKSEINVKYEYCKFRHFRAVPARATDARLTLFTDRSGLPPSPTSQPLGIQPPAMKS